MKTIWIGELSATMDEQMRWTVSDAQADAFRRLLESMTERFMSEISPADGEPGEVVFDRIVSVLKPTKVESIGEFASYPVGKHEF